MAVVRLGDVVEDITVGFVGPMASEYVDNGVLFLRSQDVLPFRLSVDNSKRITPEFHARLRKSSLREGDVVIVRTGKPGTAAVVPAGLGPANCSDLVIVRPGPLVDPDYLCSFVNGVATHQVSSRLVGAVQQHFNVGAARQLELPLPPIEEQRRVAKILTDLDDKIEVNRRMAATLDEIARTVFRSWFVDFDPVRAKASAKAEGRDPERAAMAALSGRSEADLDALPPEALASLADTAVLFPDTFGESDANLGDVPSGWKAGIIGECCKRVSMGPFGSDITRSNFVPEGIPVIRGGNLGEQFVSGDFVYLTAEKADSLGKANARAYDIVITHRGTIGQVSMVPAVGTHERYVVSQSQMVLEVDQSVASPYFVLEYLNSPEGQHWLLSNTSQVGVPAIARPTVSVKSIPVIVPNGEVSAAFDKVCRGMYDHILALRDQNRTLSDTRDTLLPRLLSGELSVQTAGDGMSSPALVGSASF